MKGVLQNSRQSSLPLGHPARVVPAHGLLIIAEQVGHIRARHAPLKENARDVCRKRCGVAGRSKGPAASNAFAIRRRQMFVTVSSRSDLATMNGRRPQRSARYCPLAARVPHNSIPKSREPPSSESQGQRDCQRLHTLHKELARNPRFFVELISIIFRADNEEPRAGSDADRDKASSAFRVLNAWRSLPATEPGRPVDIDGLRQWVESALAEVAAVHRPAIGAQEVGKALSHSPPGADSAWPHEAVRELIERQQNDDLDTGFRVGKYNARGVVSRDPTDGGRQEQALADQYQTWANAVRDQWPRTAALLRRMEARYQADARTEDAEAERRKEGRW